MRIASFSVTQLPSSNYHCRLGQPTAVREWPQHWWGHFVVDVGRQVGSCLTVARNYLLNTAPASRLLMALT